MTAQPYDLIVVGGGINGAFVAWDATLRGLRVALVEQGDFGGETSANNQRIVHGGMRYLRSGDLRRARRSARERAILMRIAPHLVHALPFLLPIHNDDSLFKAAFWTASKVQQILTLGLAKSHPSDKSLPSGRLISAEECLKLCPTLESTDLTGAALFYDGQLVCPHRLALSALLAAKKKGATLYNYRRVEGYLFDGTRVGGVKILDRLNGNHGTMRARLVVNCTGPWINESLGYAKETAPVRFQKAVVLITRSLARDAAFGVKTRPPLNGDDSGLGNRNGYLFVTPLGSKSLVGTFYAPHREEAGRMGVSADELQCYLKEFNRSWDGDPLTPEDVYLPLCGLLPTTHSESVRLREEDEIIDHRTGSQVDGLISVIGVKLTTGRHLAARTVDRVLEKLGYRQDSSLTAFVPLEGGDLPDFNKYLENQLASSQQTVDERILRNLVLRYGTQYQKILQIGQTDLSLLRPLSDHHPTISAQVIYAIHVEMAKKLADVVLRRTALGVGGLPGDGVIEKVALLMGRQCGWSLQDRNREIDEIYEEYSERLPSRYPTRQPVPVS